MCPKITQAGHKEKWPGSREGPDAIPAIMTRYSNVVRSVTPMNYTLGQAAKATGKSKTRIRRAIDSGKISVEKDEFGQWGLHEALGRKAGMASQYSNLGEVYRTRGALEQAKAMYRQALGLFKEGSIWIPGS